MIRMALGVSLVMLAGSAHAGAVSGQTFGATAPDEVVVANGVEAIRSGTFVLYQHGPKARAVVAVPMPRAPMAEPAPVAVAADVSSAPVSTGCGNGGPTSHRRLASATAASRIMYWPLVRDAECRHGLPAGLLDALVFQESRYRPLVVSRAGAGGLAQLMPRTADDLGVIDRFDAVANLDGGARYLRSMLDRYRSVPLALAAYNAGRGAVDRWGGLPLNRETPGYVRNVLTFFNEDAAARMTFAPVVAPAFSQAVSLTFGATSP
nr:lytic transglycosylase domain-containing protein [Polymorphobacter sp.]